MATDDDKIVVRLNKNNSIEVTEQALTNPALWEEIGTDMVLFSNESYGRQGLFRRNSWAKPQNPNYSAIFNDLNQGFAVKARHFEERKALKQSGRMMNATTYDKPVQPPKLKLINNVPYAKLHQEGGYSTQTKKNPALFNKNLKRAIRKYGKKLTPEQLQPLYAMAHMNEWVTKVRKRPFLGYDYRRGVRIIKSWLQDKVKDGKFTT